MEHNIIRSIQAAAAELPKGVGNIPEVCIQYGNVLLRGNRSTKKNALSTSHGFFSPNYESLGTVAHDRMELNHRFIRRVDSYRNEMLEVRRNLSKDNIAIISVYPDMDLNMFRTVCGQKNLKGLIIRTYGTGNAPDEPSDFLDILKNIIDAGVIVLNLTQCVEGRVELRLFETSASLFDIGVINGGDMTVEAAYCKMKYLLGTFSFPQDRDSIVQELQIDLRGELTDSSYNIKYKKDRDETLVRPVFYGKAKDISQFDPININSAVLRIQGIFLAEGSPVSAEDDLLIKIYFNCTKVDLKETDDDAYFKIGTFRHKIEYDDSYKQVPISKNIEVTDKIRRLIRHNMRLVTLQVVSARGHHFSFESMHLIVLTRSN